MKTIQVSMRRLLPWAALLVVAGLAVYKLKFAPVPAVAHTVTRGEVVAEGMGTGTLEARVQTTPRARTQARREHLRMTGLVATRAISQSDADKAAEALRVAEADLKRSHANIAEAEGQIVVAEKNPLFRNEQLAFTELHSPCERLVIRRDRDPGEMLVPGASLLQLISLDELWVSAWVDETVTSALTNGSPARLVVRSEPGRGYPGTVSRLGREMDRETREFPVDVAVAELPKNWTIGQRAEVSIETGRLPAAVTLPPAYLVGRAGKAGVFHNDGGRARWREVTPGLRGADHLAITRGLSAAPACCSSPTTTARSMSSTGSSMSRTA